MSDPSDTSPEPQGDALARIGDILAAAEQQVADVVAAAERDAQDGATRIADRIQDLGERRAELETRARDLDRRAAELAELTAGILTTAAEVQAYAARLAALPSLATEGGATGALLDDLPTIDEPVRPAAPAAAAREDDRPAPAAPAALHAVASDPWAESALPGDVGPRAPLPGAAPAAGPVFAEPAAAGPRAVDAAPRSVPAIEDELPIVAGSDASTDLPEKLDSARLVALSMAAEGRSRGEVEAHVRDNLGIIEHAALIDYVFGGSTPSSVVPSWPPRRRRHTS